MTIILSEERREALSQIIEEVHMGMHYGVDELEDSLDENAQIEADEVSSLATHFLDIGKRMQELARRARADGVQGKIGDD